MAIAFDLATGSSTGAASSLTFSHTCTGSNLMLFVGVYCNITTETITGVTYNGVAMTQITKNVNSSNSNLYLYALAGPATGANNVVISSSASTSIGGVAMSYTGVNQSVTLDNFNNQLSSGTTTNLTATLTSVTDNCWMIMFGGRQRVPTAGTGSTFRAVDTDGGWKGFDSNGPIHPAGANSMDMTYPSIGNAGMGQVYATFSPPIATPTVSSISVSGLSLMGVGN